VSANNSNSTNSDNVQKLNQGNILWKIEMKILLNRNYYSLVCEINRKYVGPICKTKQRVGRGSLRPAGLKGGGE